MNTLPQSIKAFERIGEENALTVLARSIELANQGRDIINLGVGQPDFKTPEHIVDAAVRALRDGHHGYTPYNGILPLREAVARRTLTTTGTDISPDNIMIVPGGKVTMFAAIMMMGEPGVEILYPDPGFPIYRSMIEFTGATPVAVPISQENNFSFDARQVLSLISKKTRLLIVNSPANPSGGVAPRSEIEALVKGLESYPQVAILSDEIYDTLIYDDQKHVSFLEFPSIRNQLIVLNGWSKTWAMTGWRLGWTIWPDQLLGDIRKFSLNGWSCVNAPAQYAGIAAIDGPQDDVENMLKAFDERRGIIVELLNKLPGFQCLVPRGAFYAFPDISQTGWKSKEFATQLLEESGVAIVGGPDFGTLGEGYVRLSYANSIENIERAIDRIGKFLNR